MAKLDVVETKDRLSIIGRDDHAKVVASLELEVGTFYMEEDDRGEVFGRQLVVDVAGSTVDHESAGLDDLALPLPAHAGMQVFLQDPTVTSALGRWGIDLDTSSAGPPVERSALANEQPYIWVDQFSCEYNFGWVSYTSSMYSGYYNCEESTWSGCSGDRVMWDKGNGEYGEYRCCWDTYNAAHRVCTSPNGSTSCGQAGPGGCKVCWTWQMASGWPSCYAITGGNGACYLDACVE